MRGEDWKTHTHSLTVPLAFLCVCVCVCVCLYSFLCLSWRRYTSFQERATKVSHGNTGRNAVKHGDEHLGEICAMIASDEARHEKA